MELYEIEKYINDNTISEKENREERERLRRVDYNFFRHLICHKKKKTSSERLQKRERGYKLSGGNQEVTTGPKHQERKEYIFQRRAQNISSIL